MDGRFLFEAGSEGCTRNNVKANNQRARLEKKGPVFFDSADFLRSDCVTFKRLLGLNCQNVQKPQQPNNGLTKWWKKQQPQTGFSHVRQNIFYAWPSTHARRSQSDAIASIVKATAFDVRLTTGFLLSIFLLAGREFHQNSETRSPIVQIAALNDWDFRKTEMETWLRTRQSSQNLLFNVCVV